MRSQGYDWLSKFAVPPVELYQVKFILHATARLDHSCCIINYSIARGSSKIRRGETLKVVRVLLSWLYFIFATNTEFSSALRNFLDLNTLAHMFIVVFCTMDCSEDDGPCIHVSWEHKESFRCTSASGTSRLLDLTWAGTNCTERA